MSISLSFSNPIISFKIFLKINLSHQDPTNYHVSNIFQSLGIFLSIEEYWYEIERLISRKYPIRIINIDFSKDKYSRHFSASYYIQRQIQGLDIFSFYY